jgi:UDP-N-acetylmuramate--alanine ligase
MGAGGIGVSALMKLAVDRGAIVSGCDLKKNSTTEYLIAQNVPVHIGHSPAHVQDQDIIVYSSAISSLNLELQFARESGIECLPRSAMLRILQEGSKLIGITGSHGKTTTTGLISHIFIKNNFDPNVAIGGICASLDDKNFHIGSPEWFVSELDESDGSMLDCTPLVGVITNIDREHIDYYGDMQKLKEAFYQFVKCIDGNGCLVICNDDPFAKELADQLLNNKKVVRYGFCDGSEFQIQNVVFYKTHTEFGLLVKGHQWHASIPLLGEHNVLNSVAAIATSDFCGIPIEKAIEFLSDYKTVKRRLDVLYNAGPIIIDDYAHHPKEIMASLKAVKSLSSRRIVAVFQAHRYTRLKDLWNDFAESLMIPDEVIICDIYSANEEPIEGVSADLFARELFSKRKQSVQYIPKFEGVMDYLRSILTKDDLLITLGAGDVNYISKNLAIEYIKK